MAPKLPLPRGWKRRVRSSLLPIPGIATRQGRSLPGQVSLSSVPRQPALPFASQPE